MLPYHSDSVPVQEHECAQPTGCSFAAPGQSGAPHLQHVNALRSWPCRWTLCLPMSIPRSVIVLMRDPPAENEKGPANVNLQGFSVRLTISLNPHKGGFCFCKR